MASSEPTTYPYVVCVLNVHGCLNVGAIMRSASLCGCRKVVVFGRRKYDKRSAVGAMHWVEVERVEGMAQDLSKVAKEVLDEDDYALDAEVFFQYMEANELLPVFIEQAPDSLPFTDASVDSIITTPGRTPCFVFGNEQYGVPENLLALKSRFAHCHSVELAQVGPLESFNVSSCASIVLYRVMERYAQFIKLAAVRPRNEVRGAAEEPQKEEADALSKH
eukprot:TRINITY_DN11502_c0_g1_i1.p1 TRINITY_DN11502_c0_g1~~TRINITY_DN11502_c0_g1_i1.p1  ORF type:complete len:238 (+),score=86.78 TRINITY_DN11502_c0_g1_i1:56-715(+)